MKLKKYAIIYMCLLSLGSLFFQQMGTKEVQAKEELVMIPDEAIRLRILANSNSVTDQNIKRTVRDEVNAEIAEWVAELTSIEKARQLIESRLPEIEAIVGETLKENNVEQTYTVEYGKRVKFPTKLYGNYIYPAGQYEAILITLGKGKGDNWWCVLFPPLCFLDFSSGNAVKAQETEEEEKEEESKTEVKFFVIELFQKIIDQFA